MVDKMLGKSVSIRSLRKSYGAVEVLHNIDLEIEAGEFCTLLGASGSGKTTILKVIAGFEDTNAGIIEIDGNDVANTAVAKRNIGMVFQNYALFPHMSVRKNVSFGLEMRNLPDREIASRISKALELVDLSDFADRLPSDLSGGQQQRVALARALVISPDILLMDEPLGALDKNLRQSIQIQLKRLHKELGITIIYVTHDQEEALHLSDKIVIMDKGKIVQRGTPQQLYFQPRNEFVACFLGECNFVRDTQGREFWIRPENMYLKEKQVNGARTVSGIVEDVIFLGSTVKILARNNGNEVIIKADNTVDAQTLSTGTELDFYVNEADILLRDEKI